MKNPKDMDKQRNAGIDYLRAISMFLITAIHFFSYTNVLYTYNSDTITIYTLCILKALTYISINFFFLNFSYFSYDKKFHLSKIIYLWMQVFCYSIFGALLSIILGLQTMSVSKFLLVVFPFMFHHYWFPISYVILYTIHPIIDSVIHNFDKKKHFIIVCAFGFLITAYFNLNPLLGIAYQNSFFGSQRGLAWILFMYLCASYIRKYPESLFVKKAKVVFACSFAFMVFWVIGAYFNSSINTLVNAFSLLSYTSFHCVLMSVSVFCIFLNSKKQYKATKLWKFKFSNIVYQSMFGVYLLQENCMIRDPLWKWVSNALDEKFLPLLLLILTFTILLAISMVVNIVFQKLCATNGMRKLFACIDTKILGKII